jgi:hypothetical protein
MSLASRSLSPITVAPELSGRGGSASQAARATRRLVAATTLAAAKPLRVPGGTGGVGLLAVGVMVLLNAGAEPPGRLAGLALRALCVGGVSWLCWRGVAPAERAANRTSANG